MDVQLRISELSRMQREHLVWRLDHKTAMGLLTAVRMVDKMEGGDLELVALFQLGGRSEHSAKIHARKVIDFTIDSAASLRVSLSEHLADTLIDLFELSLECDYNYGPEMLEDFYRFQRSVNTGRVCKRFNEKKAAAKYKEE